MKTFVSLALFSALLISPQAFAGKEAHGGNSVVCRDQSQKIISAQLFDFYEGEALYGVKPILNSSPFTEQFRAIARKLDDVSGPGGNHKQIFEDVYRRLKILPEGIKLKPIDDSNEVVVPGHCAIEQLAVFNSDGAIYIVKEVWDALTETDRAGLVAHEALFFIDRIGGAENSTYARRINALAFSGYPFVPVLQGLTKDVWACRSRTEGANGPQYSFFAHENSDGVELQFLTTNGHWLYDKKMTATRIPSEFFQPLSARPPKVQNSSPICVTVGTHSQMVGTGSVSACVTTTVTNGTVTTRFSIAEWSDFQSPPSAIEYQCHKYPTYPDQRSVRGR